MKKLILIALTMANISYALPEKRLESFAPSYFPHLEISANSEQRIPLFIGKTARETFLYNQQTNKITLPKYLESDLLKNLEIISPLISKINLPFEFEVWPIETDAIKWSWAIARYRLPNQQWQWVPYVSDITAQTPKKYSALNPKIFADVLDLDLYDKPFFSECIFEKNGLILGAWFSPSKKNKFKDRFSQNNIQCLRISRPPIFNQTPRTFIVRYKEEKINFNETIHFQPIVYQSKKLPSLYKRPIINSWPKNFEKQYAEDIQIYSGEKQATIGNLSWPLFKKKNPAQSDHQLNLLTDYLASRYALLGLKGKRQKFMWRGIPQANYIVKIPGSLPGGGKPIILADHMDTAFEENTFYQTGKRVAGPGADDNGSAFAGLLQAARILKNIKPKNDIWLVHLTGEEFPADDLGAREFLKSLFQKKKDIMGVIIMDMIGYRSKNNKQSYFQISEGNDSTSLLIGQLMEKIALEFNQTTPLTRTRFDSKTFLHQTDALIFADHGFPVVLVNEWLNEIDNWDRPHYHQDSDLFQSLDTSYAAEILKVVIESVARLSMSKQSLTIYP